MITIIESPYFNKPDACRYLACCVLDCVQRREVPWSSHLVLPLGLPEMVRVDFLDGEVSGRDIGIATGSALKSAFHAGIADWVIAFYVDLGFSSGMNAAAVEASASGSPSESRSLTGEARRIWLAGEWPTMARLTPNHEPVPTHKEADRELRDAGVDVDAFEEVLRDKIRKVKEKTDD
jgi:hypothetical protein